MQPPDRLQPAKMSAPASLVPPSLALADEPELSLELWDPCECVDAPEVDDSLDEAPEVDEPGLLDVALVLPELLADVEAPDEGRPDEVA
jgi:hypothetical protein